MGKETYQITEYVHDQVIAFANAFGLIGTTEPKEDINHLIDFNEFYMIFWQFGYQCCKWIDPNMDFWYYQPLCGVLAFPQGLFFLGK